ncbi:hypothetical protein TcBrA4_0132420 [Trypanosoma cruzi]|nr:hypothetical protein TcBrA4_0132420 [Trypanosoma cruzi]
MTLEEQGTMAADKFLFYFKLTDTASLVKETHWFLTRFLSGCDIGARLWDLVRQRGEAQVQTTFINGTEMPYETLTVAPSSTGLCLILGNATKPWEDSSLTGHIASSRAFRVPNFENQLILPIMGATRELGRVARTNHC